jgi:Icc-related predicted phosphoesterase
MLTKIRQYIIFLLIFTISAVSCISETVSLRGESSGGRDFLIWSHSDIQPRSEGEKSHYEKAVEDVSDNFTSIDIALFAGDIVQKSHFKEIYLWYLDTRKNAPVKEWFDIAGNHEWRAIDLYKKHINKDLYYSIERGNLLILMMSNEKEGRKTWISDSTFRWWEEMVVNNQDKIIITVTHATLEGNGLSASKLDRLKIADSGRFREVLKKYKVDIWISGHSHIPGWMPGTEITNSRLGGTTFIDNGAIRDDFLATIESRFIYFREGSDQAIMKKRNHRSGRFYSDDFTIPLAHPFSKE